MIVSLDRLELPPRPPRGSIVSIGVFDGVHLGHQAILRMNVERARSLGAAATVVTFHEHPKKVLLGHAPRTLTSLEHRVELFDRAGIEHTVALTFDERLRKTGAREFVDGFLVGELGARLFVLGFDSKFGRDREGTPEFVRSLGHTVEVVPRVVVAARAVSSTAIREAVELGDLEGAARMLGRPVSVYGSVVEGDRIGRQLGFPTANLDLHHEIHPPPGVYACRVRLRARGGSGSTDGSTAPDVWPAVANIGFRPTIEPGASPAIQAPRIEVHILGFDGDLYGESMEVEFHGRLRGEERFPDLDSLRAGIARDIDQARTLLSRR